MSIVEISSQSAIEQQEESPNFTEEDFVLWLNLFVLGQRIFDGHVGNEDPITDIHLCQSYKGNLGREKVACYIEELDLMAVSFKFVEADLIAIKKYLTKPSSRITNVHLNRLGVCTTPNLAPLFTGIEERAHAYFHKHVKPNLDPKEINFTGMYDGSDSSEEYAFQQIASIILRNKNLTLDPLPEDFAEKLVISIKEKANQSTITR